MVSDRVWRGGAGRPGFEDIGEDDSLSTTSAGEHDGPVELSHIDLARMTGKHGLNLIRSLPPPPSCLAWLGGVPHRPS